ncbi:MAG: hypothetical protein IJT53_01910 [Prevotella sp.]|nr:hypothetical protein [Prevotella sp.]
MKKIYQSPETILVKVVNTQHLLEASQGGVATGGTPGDEYTSTDVSYGRSSSLWDDED